MKRLLITLRLIFILCSITYADDYTLKQLKESDGLSQSTVFAMMQDTQGYLWFGTIEGLNRYDGYNFRIYVNSPDDSMSISDDFISTIFEDSEKNIWVGTRNGYFNKFNRETETFKRFNVNHYFEMLEKPGKDYYEYPLAFSRSHNYSVTSITEDGDSFLWIGTWGNGLLRFDKKNETALHFYNLADFHLSLSNNRIMDILIDREKTVWIATFGGGLNRVISNPNTDLSSTELSKYSLLFFSYRNQKHDNYSLSDDKVISLFEDKDETIWIGTYDGGLNKLDRKNRSLPPSNIKFLRYVTLGNTDNSICNNTVMDIAQDYDGYLWIGTFGGGIDRLDIEAESFRHYYNDTENLKPLPDNEILSLLVDKSGILWVGAHLGEGITKIQKNTAKFKYLISEPRNSQSLNDNIVWAIHKDNNNTLWVGTYRGGLNFIDQNNNKSIAYQYDIDDPGSISDNHIRAIKEDNFNNLWIGTYNGGINRFKTQTAKFERFLNDPENPNSLSANQVQDIFIDSDTTIWVATFGGGLNKLSFKTNSSDELPEFTVYENDPSDSTTLTDNRVYVLYEDSKENFWVGTYGGGLNKFNRNTGRFISFKNNPDDPNSISNNKIISIYEDSQEILWIGTSGGGLNKFDLDTKKFTRYSSGKATLPTGRRTPEEDGQSLPGVRVRTRQRRPQPAGTTLRGRCVADQRIRIRIAKGRARA